MKTVAVFFGGQSAEHDVSIVTAISSVIRPLTLTKQYNVLPVYISKQGNWYAGKQFGEISLYSTGKIDTLLAKTKAVGVDLNNGLSIIYPSTIAKRVAIDVAFPAMHGTNGEDGSLMGLLRLANVPFVGCDMEASVIAMNKLLSHQIVSATGLQSHAYVGVNKHEWLIHKDSIKEQLGKLPWPLFVKPVHLGSSIGITCVSEWDKLDAAIDVAFSYDATIIIEEAVSSLIEVTVPVMGANESPRVGCVERPLLKPGDTFDFEAKYMNQGKTGGKKMGGDSGAQGYSEVPAKLAPGLYERCETVAKHVYQALGCDGIARVDLLIDSEAQQVYFNEVNPLPGSLYAHNWSRAGVSTVSLVNALVDRAIERQAIRQSITTTFDTNFLKQF